MAVYKVILEDIDPEHGIETRIEKYVKANSKKEAMKNAMEEYWLETDVGLKYESYKKGDF